MDEKQNVPVPTVEVPSEHVDNKWEFLAKFTDNFHRDWWKWLLFVAIIIMGLCSVTVSFDPDGGLSCSKTAIKKPPISEQSSVPEEK